MYSLVQFLQQHTYTTTFSWLYFWAKWITLVSSRQSHSEQVCFIVSSVLLLSFPKKFSQGPTRSCWRDASGTYLWHLQCLWNCCLWLTVFTLLRSDKDIKYGFQISRKHWRSVFVFSLLLKLIWFGEMAELSKSVLSNFKKMSWYQPLMYGSKPHILECIFYRSRTTKIKFLYIGLSHVGKKNLR